VLESLLSKHFGREVTVDLEDPRDALGDERAPDGGAGA
jgi:hypothetical protein